MTLSMTNIERSKARIVLYLTWVAAIPVLVPVGLVDWLKELMTEPSTAGAAFDNSNGIILPEEWDHISNILSPIRTQRVFCRMNEQE